MHFPFFVSSHFVRYTMSFNGPLYSGIVQLKVSQETFLRLSLCWYVDLLGLHSLLDPGWYCVTLCGRMEVEGSRRFVIGSVMDRDGMEFSGLQSDSAFADGRCCCIWVRSSRDSFSALQLCFVTFGQGGRNRGFMVLTVCSRRVCQLTAPLA